LRTATLNDTGRATLVARKLPDGRLAIEQSGRTACCYLTPSESARLVHFIRDAGPRAVTPAKAMLRWTKATNTTEAVPPAA
jgi:hypothetical protein